MSKWRAIHPAIRLCGTDGFRMLLFEMPSYKDLAELTVSLAKGEPNELEEPMRRLIPDGPIPRNPKDLLKMYMNENATSSFCVGNANRFDPTANQSSKFLCGFRSDKDMFKFLLMREDTEQVSVWGTNTNFFVRIAADDNVKLKYETV